uniref:Tudor domain containing 7 n=1 Tax=Astatotilapia calliptera TaxID=8154 RepID=A0A3P8N9D7_ASTCA
MADAEFVKRILRAVLQSSKDGVSIDNLQSEYRSLCGENIPLEKLGFSKLEDYLRSIPSVVKLEYGMGQLQCLAAVYEETANIAQLVARQKTSKKSGRSQIVNCKMRFKPPNSYMLNVRPRTSLRQPSAHSKCYSSKNRSWPYGGYRGFSASGDYRKLDQGFSSITPVEHRQPAPQPALKPAYIYVANRKEKNLMNSKGGNATHDRSNPSMQDSEYDVELVQSQISQLLEKYYSGLWMSKLSELYCDTFSRNLHPQVLRDMAKWTHVCTVNVHFFVCLIYLLPKVEELSTNRADQLVYPPLPTKKSPVPLKSTTSTSQASLNNLSTTSTHFSSCPSTPESPCTQVTFNPTSDSTPCPPSKPCAVVSADVRQKIKELLSKYSQGLWAHAMPKLFMEAYKVPFPEHVLDNLSLLLDICVLMGNTETAILYKSSRADIKPTDGRENQQGIRHPLPSGLKVLSPVVPPSLVLPSVQYPSVLVTEVKTTNAVTVRYVGENYSNAQEAMEDAMQTFYSQNSIQHPVSNPIVGQLVAVRGEDGAEMARGQVLEVRGPNKVKVYYMDYGFSVETNMKNLLELHRDFLSLPFQATNVQLAGLERFSSHPLVLSLMDNVAIGKILLMETLEPCQESEVPTAVLYDTSQDDDLNINSACLKVLQDKTMNNPLSVNVTYQDVSVTNVCQDGTLYCQLPSRGTARLSKLLEETEAYFISQITSEFLVSRPFIGKFCLARYKEKWARVEITNMYGNRVMEISVIDFGVPATLELTDLREIPPLLLKDFIIIPPQAIKCRLADLPVPEGDWSQEAILWVKEAVMGSEACRMKILKLNQDTKDTLVYMYLFIGVGGQHLDDSINHHLAQSELWKKLTIQNNTITSCNMNTGLTPVMERSSLSSSVSNPAVKASPQLRHIAGGGDATTKTQTQLLQLPPLLDLPLPGQNIDVFVPVACHPGYFVLQAWHDLHKLVVLMGEMMLYYNQTGKTNPTTTIQKGHIYAAKIDKNWHRVKVKGSLSNGLVSVYQLDYGKHELVHSTLIRPLIEEFRQLPFQAMTAQLAGVTQHQWSEDSSMLFRNHVENRALVAVVDSVQDVSEVKGEPWERRLTVYLVDTTVDNQDLWIHTVITAIDVELS